MSTPVNQLPNNKPPSMPVPDDPEVLNVLQEMEQEVKTATAASRMPAGPPPPPQYMMMQQPPPVAQYQVKKAQSSKWINYDIMKRTGIVAALALVLFYPKTLESMYTSFPKLAFLEKFDVAVRAILLAIVVYVVTIQFGL